jgi:hypothetical protein
MVYASLFTTFDLSTDALNDIFFILLYFNIIFYISSFFYLFYKKVYFFHLFSFILLKKNIIQINKKENKKENKNEFSN